MLKQILNINVLIPESERSTTLEPLPEARAEWRPAVLPDSDVVRAIEAVEGIPPSYIT